jgi:hypothetical protein
MGWTLEAVKVKLRFSGGASPWALKLTVTVTDVGAARLGVASTVMLALPGAAVFSCRCVVLPPLVQRMDGFTESCGAAWATAKAMVVGALDSQ